MGRARELAILAAALQEAGDGRGSVAVLVGEAGIGKTRTAQELATRAEKSIAVLRGRCYEGEETPPYGPWRTALRGLPACHTASNDAGIFPAAGNSPLTLPAADARLRLFDAVIEALRAASVEQTLLLVLDNLQWADPGSLKLLEHLGAEIADAAILVVGTYRDSDLYIRHPLQSTLAELAKGDGFRRIVLGGLSLPEVGEYLLRVTDMQPGPGLVQEIHDRTDGNPLFLLELVRDMTEAQQASIGQLRIPLGVREAISARLARMPDEDVRLLAAASVIGRIFPLNLLAQIAEDVPSAQVLPALERARGAGFVQEMPEEPGRYRFTHALVQEVLCDRLPAPQRSRCHARIAEALAGGADADENAAVIAQHLAEASEPGSLATLVRFTLKAADHAVANLAPDQAVAILDRALEAKSRSTRTPDAETAELLYRRGRALDDMAASEAAAESLTRAFDVYETLGNVTRMVDVALTPVQRAIRMGPSVTWSYADSGLPALRERALGAVAPDTVPQGRLLAHQPASADIEKALAIARRAGDETLEMTALWHLSYAHLCAGDTTRARREEEEARAMAGRLGDHWGARFLLYWRCRSSCLVGDLPALQASAREMLEDAERAHSRLSLAAAHQASAIVAHLVGDWDGCREHARTCLRLQPARGETHSRSVVLATLALTEYETGHKDLADEQMRSLGGPAGDAPAPFPIYLPKMAWITGDTSRIDAAAESLGQIAAADSPFEWVTMSRNSACALVAVLRGDRAEAARYLEYYFPWRGLHIPWNASGMASDVLVALLLATLGRYDEALDAFETALVFCRRTGYRPELARCCRDYGELLVRRGASERAIEVLGEGLAVARSLGMAPTTERIETAMGQAHARASSARIPESRAGLSVREVEILRLVARGFTNAEIGDRLFISPNTVARHIQNVLEKTGMANRTEVTAFAFRNGLIES